MIKIVDQVEAAVHGHGEKFNMARAMLTNVINGKTVEYSAVIDLDRPARAMQDGRARSFALPRHTVKRRNTTSIGLSR